MLIKSQIANVTYSTNRIYLYLSEDRAYSSSRYSYSPGEMLQRYIRALADPSVIILIILQERQSLGAVARMGWRPHCGPICTRIDYTIRVAPLGCNSYNGLAHISSDYTKDRQQTILRLLPRSSQTRYPLKKRQQAFLAPLPAGAGPEF